MRSVALLATLLLVASAAGCMGHCGPTDMASWRQEGLHASLLASGREAELREAPPGLVVDSEPLRARYGDLVLRSVGYQPEDPGERSLTNVMLDHNEGETRVHVNAPPEWTDEQVVALFRGFLQNVSAAPQERWAEWERALLASRSPSAYGPNMQPIANGYSTTLDGALRLGELIEDLGGPAAFQLPDHVSPGSLGLSSGGWSLSFHLPVRTYRLDTAGGQLLLSVDALDQASFSLSRKDESSDHGAALRFLADALRDLGLDAPPLGAGDVRTVVC